VYKLEDDKKLIDTSELIRVFGNIQSENNNKEHYKTTEDIESTSTKDKIIGNCSPHLDVKSTA